MASTLAPGLAQAQSPSACRFLTPPHGSTKGREVLSLSGDQAKLHFRGRVLLLKIRELPCGNRCVAPGRPGQRELELIGDGLRATLVKPLLCSRDSEVCSGLPAGPATLTLLEARGRTVLRLWNDDCDS